MGRTLRFDPTLPPREGMIQACELRVVYTSLFQASGLRPNLILYKTNSGIRLQVEDRWYSVQVPWDELITRDNLEAFLQSSISEFAPATAPQSDSLLAPIGSEEVWAAGVTYHRSRDARMEEAKSAGSGDFYDRVYNAERPELFFKATARRVVGPGGAVAIRSDA